MLRCIYTAPPLKGSHLFLRFPVLSLVPFSTTAPKISILDYLVNRHHFSPKSAANASASSAPKLLHNPQNADSVLYFFTEAGLSKPQIEALVQKSPWVLSARLESSIKPKFKVFQDLGFCPSDAVEIFSANPWLLRSSSSRLRQSVLQLKNVFGNHVCELLKKSRHDWILANNTMVPNIEYLKSCGICPLQITTYACSYLRLYLFNTEKLKGYVNRVDELGVPRDSKMFLHAIKVISSMTTKNWELKLKLFRDLGFSEQNILHAFRIAPFAFGLSERNVKETTQILLSVTDIPYVAKNPHLLTYSVEKRLKPRLRVLKALESKNLINRRPFFTSFLQMTDAKFIETYVSPYSGEIRDLYVGKQCS